MASCEQFRLRYQRFTLIYMTKKKRSKTCEEPYALVAHVRFCWGARAVMPLSTRVEVGGRKFFIRTAEDECDMSYLGYYFREGRYGGVVGTMLLRTIYLILWTLLLIIPGIIKSYAYRMVPYILADNPSIGASRAIELSNEMTQGEKWEMFVLDLSFIGWYLVGLLALGIGVLFVMPYEDATKAELYLHLRDRAVERGATTLDELHLIVAEEG